ncbi:hypothetical protein DENSPDRAFT_129699 [Dentipellis sp. KUC8613]|nr:hypothetical protein DENSPDRAFT_129699 [Dentipellis sp. KUC8613]
MPMMYAAKPLWQRGIVKVPLASIFQKRNLAKRQRAVCPRRNDISTSGPKTRRLPYNTRANKAKLWILKNPGQHSNLICPGICNGKFRGCLSVLGSKGVAKQAQAGPRSTLVARTQKCLGQGIRRTSCFWTCFGHMCPRRPGGRRCYRNSGCCPHDRRRLAVRGERRPHPGYNRERWVYNT